MRAAERWGGSDALAIALIVGVLGVLTPIAADVAGADGAPLEFTLDPGATISYIAPTGGFHRVVTSTESISGSYTLVRDDTVQSFEPFYSFTEFHLVTASGKTIDAVIRGPGSDQDGMRCSDGSPSCQMITSFATQGVPNAGSSVYSQDDVGIGITGRVPAFLGQTWDNIELVSWSNTLETNVAIAALDFHATRQGAEGPPVVWLDDPAEGTTYWTGEPRAAAYECIDASGTGIASLTGPSRSATRSTRRPPARTASR